MFLFDEKIRINYATEATNVVWENLAVSSASVKIRLFITVVVIIGILFWALFLFTVLKSQAAKNLFSFPPSTDCKSISSLFQNVNDLTYDLTSYKKYAINDKV